jgi:hypothetical protein
MFLTMDLSATSFGQTQLTMEKMASIPHLEEQDTAGDRI